MEIDADRGFFHSESKTYDLDVWTHTDTATVLSIVDKGDLADSGCCGCMA